MTRHPKSLLVALVGRGERHRAGRVRLQQRQQELQQRRRRGDQAGVGPEEGRHPAGAVGRGLRAPRPGIVVLPARLRGGLCGAPAAVLVQAGRPHPRRARPGGVGPPDLARREDGDDQDSPERQVQPARQPRGHVEGRQVRHRARLQPQCRQRLRPVVLQRRRRGRHGEGRTDRRHPDARRHDDRVQAHQAVRRDDGQGAVAATVGARAQGVRGQDQRRRQVPERLRLRPGQAGIHGAVRHQVLRGRQEHRAGPEPELGPRGLRRLPAGLRGRGELADRDRPERLGPQDPHRPGPDQRRHPGCPGGQARGPRSTRTRSASPRWATATSP